MIKENKVSKYMLYAIGEIVLVVIGILIALQINNNNELRKAREKELHYLSNIKSDLHLSIDEMNKFIETRNTLIESSKTIIEHFDGKPITSLAEFNLLCIPVFAWKKYYHNNNTFQELINSGNFALISNDSIKNSLLNIEMLYKKLKSEEDHYRYDTEVTFYGPIYKFLDVIKLTTSFSYHISNGQVGEDIALSQEQFDILLNSMEVKNGFTFTILEYTIMNTQMNEMIKISENIINHIDNGINKG